MSWTGPKPGEVESAKPAASNPLHSLFHYGPMLVVAAIAIADSQRVTDPDLWGHIRFGQMILATGRVPTHDIYSYSAAGHVWRDHEWLAEVLMALAYDHAGVIGLKLLKLLCTAATVAFAAAALAETAAPIFWQFLLLIVVSVSIAPEMQLRPQMFTFAFFSATILLLTREAYRGRAALWWMVPLLGLWANLHGGFIMGVAALGVYATIATGVGVLRRRGGRRGVTILIVAAVAGAATILNPYGPGIWLVIGHALHNPDMAGTIDWFPLLTTLAAQWRLNHAGTVYLAIALVLVGALAVTLIMTRERDDWPLVAVAFIMIAAAFMAVRNYPLAELAIVPPLARRIGETLPSAAESSGKHGAMGGAAFGIASLAILVWTGLFSPRLSGHDPYPAGAVNFIQQHALNGNLLVRFDWGEYAIWHLYPHNRVFIDGRYDIVYPSEIIEDYLKFHFNRPGAEAVLRKYPHDLILVGSDMPAGRLMRSAPGWTLIYGDSISLLFARTSAGLPGPAATGKPSTQFP